MECARASASRFRNSDLASTRVYQGELVMLRRFILATLASAPLLACGKSTPPEPITAPSDPVTPSLPSAAPQPPSTVVTSAASSGGSSAVATDKGTVLKHGGPDPLDGKFTLAEATKELKGTGALLATIE